MKVRELWGFKVVLRVEFIDSDGHPKLMEPERRAGIMNDEPLFVNVVLRGIKQREKLRRIDPSARQPAQLSPANYDGALCRAMSHPITSSFI